MSNWGRHALDRLAGGKNRVLSWPDCAEIPLWSRNRQFDFRLHVFITTRIRNLLTIKWSWQLPWRPSSCTTAMRNRLPSTNKFLWRSERAKLCRPCTGTSSPPQSSSSSKTLPHIRARQFNLS
ncbi:uncharacterized protein LOC112128016 [Cimex lectularius]|uniref:Uncharacterized protein n=1 Tax=Cimex lectularius TaxID=79782 RepID=A0A8I6TL42_CIMLE|nr:uncharacterized protein LOC112128016 [Cimex lectularius]